jgi:copper(I)-binding protein
MNLRQWAAPLLAASCILSGACASAAEAEPAPVKVENPWLRASVPGQKASGGFMVLTAQRPLQLVGVESPAAAVAEVHEMKMEGDVMRMRAIDHLDLPQGVAVALKPGGYHLMLQQLKAPLVKDTQVPLTLIFKDAQGAGSRLQLQVPVRMAAPGADGHGHGGHMH